MGQTTTYSTERAIHSYLGWWTDAGVDAAVSETAHNWLGVVTPTKAAVAPQTHTKASFTTRNDIVAHLMTADLAEAGPPHRRIAPTGNPASDLMILVDFPDAADVDAGLLLSDRIFDKMLEALAATRETVYLAPLCPGRPVTGRLSAEAIETFGALAKQHIALIAPKRLWLIGTAASRAILGIDDAAAKGNLHHVNHGGTTMDAIATAHPRMFDGSKSRKAAAWAEMQRLIVRDDA